MVDVALNKNICFAVVSNERYFVSIHCWGVSPFFQLMKSYNTSMTKANWVYNGLITN
jgi:hypothetical protein